MYLLQKLPGFTRSAPGLEWKIWKKLPLILFAGTALPMVATGIAWFFTDDSASDARALQQFFYTMVGVVVLHWTLVLTLAIGCVIVLLMKGPAYVADGYPLEDHASPLE